MNNSRASAAFTIGVGVLMMMSILSANIPEVALSNYFAVPFRKELCAALFLLGALSGTWSFLRSVSRNKQPWKVPQAQVTLPYAVFFVSTLLAIVISR